MSFLRKQDLGNGYAYDIFDGALIISQRGKMVCQINIGLISHENAEKASLTIKTMIELSMLDLITELNSNRQFASNYTTKSK